ncbi:hypothetical protein SynSYN20_00848 [Synechococcus sp. SYN20]|uniref:hypothetical protein n=1 Tax=Synechococcus sp. SYN20 TaxID=1050714 RepID=UPI00164686FD|nr:hypothetical protein [Synechococcus sp. SYN20]QNJ25190.1 hypothetical protein SynSYN20_00848 [Synechococcus sp. SYN20]
MSPRKYRNPGQTPQQPDGRGFFRGPNPQEQAAYLKQLEQQAAIKADNRKAAQARQLMQGLPDGMKNDTVRSAADRAVDAREYLSSPGFRNAAGLTALGAGVGVVGIEGLKAYSNQANDYLPTDPLAIAGRMANNIGGSGAVGLDPLAEARNNVAAARQIVGSENMLAALAEDEIAQLRGEQDIAMQPTEYSQFGVQQMIDQRVGELMQQPIQRSDGSVAPMPYDQAQRIATEQVNMELRAGSAY